MSKTFTSTTTSRELTAYSAGGGLTVAVADKVITLANADAPALALAILEAAGVKPKSFNESNAAEMALAHLREHVGIEASKAKEAADREALERRRDEVAKELGGDTISYKMCNRPFQNAIDRIIELEAKS